MRRANEKISSLKHHFEGDLTNFVQTLLKNLDSKILVANKNDKLIFMNRSMKQLIQMDFTDVNSETLLGDLSAEIIENLNPYFEKAKEKLIPTKFNSIMFPAASDNTSASGKLVPLVVETQYKGMICIFERISKLSRNLSSFEKRKDTGVNFKLVYEKSPYSIIITNLNGDIKYLNPAFEELLGYERRNLLEANVFQINIYVEDSLEILRKEYNKFLQMGHKNYPLEFKIRKKDGKIIWIELDAEFIYQENNTYIISFLKDISNRKEIELALQYSERRFRQLLSQYQTFLEIISDPIYVLNENLKFQLINSTGCKAVGMKETDLLYQKITDLFPGIKQTLYYRAYRKVLKTGQKETIIKNFVHPDGQKSLYEVRIFPIPKGILCIARDITELNLIKTQLKESEQKFRTIAEQSLLGIAIIQNNEVKYMNETYAQIYGYTVGEMKKWTIKKAKNAIHPADRDKVINKLIKKQNGSDHVKKHYQYRAITKDGDIRWLDNYSKSIIYKEKPANLVTIIDITKRKKIEEKLRYQAELVENVSDAVISMDIHFHILSWNNAAEKIYGWKEEEVLGRRIDRLLKIKFLRSTKEEVLSEFDKEGSWKGEVIQSHKNGSKLYIYSSINIFRDKLTENLRIVSTNRDISQRKQAERKLKESEEKFRTITEQSVIGVHILKNSKTVYLNNALTNIFESPKSIMQNWKLRDFMKKIDPRDVPNVLKKYKNIITDKEGTRYIRYSCRIHTKSEKTKWVRIISKLINYQGDNTVLSTILDISNIKRAEKKLKSLNKMKSQLLRRTSHELKTPLVSIKGFSDLLLKFHSHELTEETTNYIKQIQGGCQRLEELIKDILKTAQLESSRGYEKKNWHNLAKLINSAEKEFQPLAEMRNIEIKMDLGKELYTLFNREEIKIVIKNLVLNSIKYTPPGGQITIKSDKDKNFILTAIRDTGVGFTEEEKGLIFQKFGKIERYGNGYVLDSEGTGLGLFMSKLIIELHGGKIWLESDGKHKGSTFYFTLPCLDKNSV